MNIWLKILLTLVALPASMLVGYTLYMIVTPAVFAFLYQNPLGTTAIYSGGALFWMLRKLWKK